MRGEALVGIAKRGLGIEAGVARRRDDVKEEPTEELDGMHTVESAEDDVEVPEADEDTRKEDIY